MSTLRPVAACIFMPYYNHHRTFSFLLALSLFSCGHRQEPASYIDNETRTIPINVLHYTSANFNDLFSIEKIVRLATNDSVLIGRVDKIRWSENKFYLLDKRSNYIDVFDTAGRFLFKISSIGEGKYHYFRIADFDIDSATQEIDVLDDFKRKLILFSGTTGQPIGEKSLFNFTVNNLALTHHNKSRQLIYSRGGTAESSDMWYNILITDSANNILGHLLPYTSTASFIMSPEQPLQRTGERISYLPPFSSTIFGLNDDHTLSAKYILRFQGASDDFEKMEAHLRQNNPKTINEFLSYLDDNNYIKFLNYLETDSLLYIYYSTALQGNQFLLYEKNKDSARLISTIRNNYINFSGQPLATAPGNRFISLIEPDSFLDKERLKNYLPPKDRSLFKDFDSKANPMLLILKAKSF